MYPSTTFDIIDNSAITSLAISSDNTMYRLLEMAAFTSDKGPEDYREVSGSEFFSLYGSSISFEKHGQPLLQAAMAINSGARLYAKRVVAEDSALANVGLVAVISPAKRTVTSVIQSASTNIYYALAEDAASDPNSTIAQIFAANNGESTSTPVAADEGDELDDSQQNEQGTESTTTSSTALAAIVFEYNAAKNVYLVKKATFDDDRKVNGVDTSDSATVTFPEGVGIGGEAISVLDYTNALNGYTDTDGITHMPYIKSVAIKTQATTETKIEDINVLHYKTISVQDIKYDASDTDTNGLSNMEDYKKHMNVLKAKFIKKAQDMLLEEDEEFDTDYYVNILAEIAKNGTISKEVYFPLFVIGENGRGVSNKTFKIEPDYAGSKYYQFIKYQFEIKEDNKTLETLNFAINPSTSYEGKNLSIETAFKDSKQLRVKQYADNMTAFINVLAALLGISADDLNAHDILTLKNNKKKSLETTLDRPIVYVEDVTAASDITIENGVKYINSIPITTDSAEAYSEKVDISIPSKIIVNGETISTANVSVAATLEFDHKTYYDDGTNTDEYYASTIDMAEESSTNAATEYSCKFNALNLSKFIDSTLSSDTYIVSVNLTLSDGTAYSVTTSGDVTDLLTSYESETLADDGSVVDAKSLKLKVTESDWVKVTVTTTDSEVNLLKAVMKDRVITDHAFIELGDNGIFGDSPIDAQYGLSSFAYTDVSSSVLNGKTASQYLDDVDHYNGRMEKVFTGYYDNCIYDLDNVKIDAIVDANYSIGVSLPSASYNDRYHDVKKAIQEFVSFREDILYFADLGTGLNDLTSILDAFDKLTIKDKFTAAYHNSYNIVDPYTYKEITVTIGYDIAQLLVAHFANGRNRPFAGLLYNITLDNVVEGTLNYVPVKIPGLDEKETLDDERINYASYYDGVLVIETLYTAQTNYTQFSFLNNVLIVQQLIKDIRSECPKIRYSFLDGDDLTFYQSTVQSVIDNRAPSFLSVTFEYVQDDTYAQNKIFYGAIEVKFRNFVQSEYFKVTAIG